MLIIIVIQWFICSSNVLSCFMDIDCLSDLIWGHSKRLCRNRKVFLSYWKVTFFDLRGIARQLTLCKNTGNTCENHPKSRTGSVSKIHDTKFERFIQIWKDIQIKLCTCKLQAVFYGYPAELRAAHRSDARRPRGATRDGGSGRRLRNVNNSESTHTNSCTKPFNSTRVTKQVAN